MIENVQQQKPLVCSFVQLAFSTRALHRWEKSRVDNLHDIWKKGAPSPRAIVRNPKGYDPRKQQAGNYEPRIVFPKMLTTWMIENAKSIGIEMTPEIAAQLIDRIALALASGKSLSKF